MMAATRLHLLCVTLGEPHAFDFLQKQKRVAELLEATYTCVLDGRQTDQFVDDGVMGMATAVIQSQGYLESILERALEVVPGARNDYVLRLDDDELPSIGLAQWLDRCHHWTADHWKFDRRHWWNREGEYIVNGPLFPDHQTRLSIRSKAGGRGVIHAGSPFGGGELAPAEAYIAHHKFLVKSREEREAVAARYDQVMPGAGTAPGMIAFQLPESMDSILTRFE